MISSNSNTGGKFVDSSSITSLPEDRFRPSADSLNFFRSKKSINEVRQKLIELRSDQKSVEEILKKEVRENYLLFLQTKQEIGAIDNNIAELQILVDDTIELIQTLKGLNVQESAMHTSIEIGIQNLEATEPANTSSEIAIKDLPSWVLTAADELDTLIVTQQYQPATNLILQMRKYRKSVESNFQKLLDKAEKAKKTKFKEQYDKLLQISEKVEEATALLSTRLKKSLANLSKGQLWGYEEHGRRLRMLVGLGKYQIAAHAFCDGQRDLVERSTRALQSTGDPLEFITLLSDTFFSMLVDAAGTFLDLFSNQTTVLGNQTTVLQLDPVILAYLMQWVQSQIIILTNALLPQLKAGIMESSTNFFVQLKAKYAIVISTPNPTPRSSHQAYTWTTESPNPTPRSSHQPLTTPTESPNPTPRSSRQIIAASGRTYADPNPFQQPTEDEETRYQRVRREGPLLFLSRCLDSLWTRAARLDALSLQGRSCVGLHIANDIKMIIDMYGDSLAKEITNQARQETWKDYEISSVGVLLPSQRPITAIDSNNKGAGGNDKKRNVCQTYDWFTALLTHFFDDVWSLFKVSSEDVPSPTNHVTTESADAVFTYTRLDITALEPVVLSCLLRVVSKYVLELERISISAALDFDKSQMACFVTTLKATVVHLIPSIQSALSATFISERIGYGNYSFKGQVSVLEKYPPQMILQALSHRLETRGKALLQS